MSTTAQAQQSQPAAGDARSEEDGAIPRGRTAERRLPMTLLWGLSPLFMQGPHQTKGPEMHHLRPHSHIKLA